MTFQPRPTEFELSDNPCVRMLITLEYETGNLVVTLYLREDGIIPPWLCNTDHYPQGVISIYGYSRIRIAIACIFIFKSGRGIRFNLSAESCNPKDAA